MNVSIVYNLQKCDMQTLLVSNVDSDAEQTRQMGRRRRGLFEGDVIFRIVV